MAWCPVCGHHWIVRTGARVMRGMVARSSNDVIEVVDLTCPTCDRTPAGAATTDSDVRT